MPGIIALLQRRGLQKIARVKIIRHQDKRYDLPALLARGHFEAGYQPYQARPVFNCDYIVSCLGLPGLKAQFLGVYRVVGQRPASEVPLPPHLAYLKSIDPSGWAVPGLVWYDLSKVDGFEDMERRVVIDWGAGALAWAQWATAERDKAIVEMAVTVKERGAQPTAPKPITPTLLGSLRNGGQRSAGCETATPKTVLRPLAGPSPTEKRSRLRTLAKLRQATRWLGYTSIADYHNGAYECDYVSPYSKTAGNVDAAVMVLLQDWASDGDLRGALDQEAKRLGYTPGWQTNRTLEELLSATFGLSLSDIYGTNLFPFVKPGAASSPIPQRDMIRAAREFAVPQIEIIKPRLVVCLGLATFNALQGAQGIARAASMESAIDSSFNIGSSRVWCQAHTGAFGQMNRKRAGFNPSQDWMRMKDALA